MNRHPGEGPSDRRCGDEIVDGLHSNDVDGAGDGVDLLGEPIERAVDYTEKPGRDSWIQLQDVGEVVHGRIGVINHVSHTEIDLRQGEDGGAGLDQLARKWHGGVLSVVTGFHLLYRLLMVRTIEGTAGKERSHVIKQNQRC